jgi:tetratricopeptide (TPR) repeat protein
MCRLLFLIICFCVIAGISSYAGETDYSSCESIQDMIERETRKISSVSSLDNDELAQLYVSRGESYLLDAQYEKAIEDFQIANSIIGHSRNLELAMAVAFRATFGEVVSYDNLGMDDHAKQALEQLQVIVTHVGCHDCIEDRPCKEAIIPAENTLSPQDLQSSMNKDHACDLVVLCKHKKDKGADRQQKEQENYSQEYTGNIFGPDEPPRLGWCEDVVTGVGRTMVAIACLARNPRTRIALIGLIEALISRGVRCCQAGGFWKACVAPISRKLGEWQNNVAKHAFPNEENLPLYLNIP